MNNIVITFSGKAHSGKDLCTELITEYLLEKDQRVFKLAFADYLKVLCKRNFGFDENNKEAGREILQLFGTDIVRTKDPMFWVETTYNTIDVLRDFYDVFIISDVRFENELQPYPWNMGYPIFNIFVNRNSNDEIDGKLKQHSSEGMANNPDLSKFHFVIDNNGTVDDLKEKCAKLADEIITARDKFIEELIKK